MSKTNTALLAKFLLTFLAALLTFGFLDYNTWWSVFMIALIGTIINYLLGDLVVLPRVGNITASIGDGIMASLVAYIITYTVAGLNTFSHFSYRLCNFSNDCGILLSHLPGEF